METVNHLKVFCIKIFSHKCHDRFGVSSETVICAALDLALCVTFPSTNVVHLLEAGRKVIETKRTIQ